MAATPASAIDASSPVQWPKDQTRSDLPGAIVRRPAEFAKAVVGDLAESAIASVAKGSRRRSPTAYRSHVAEAVVQVAPEPAIAFPGSESSGRRRIARISLRARNSQAALPSQAHKRRCSIRYLSRRGLVLRPCGRRTEALIRWLMQPGLVPRRVGSFLETGQLHGLSANDRDELIRQVQDWGFRFVETRRPHEIYGEHE